MEKCIKCGATLPAGAKVCPYCGNPVSLYEEKMQPVQPVSKKQARWRPLLILAVVVLSALLVLSLVFAFMQWTAPAKLVVSPGSIDYGTLQVGSQGSQVITLTNSGRQDLNWTANKGNADWLTLDLSQGRIPPGGSQTSNVRADTTLLTAGRYSANITFSSNGGEASVSAVLIVTGGQAAPGVSVVSSISPTSGPAAGGTTVTITGSGFTGASKVLFGTVAASSFTVNSDTQITAVSPVGSGTVHVTVITSAGTSVTSNADQFTYQVVPPVPTITSISPTSGPIAGKTSVIIRGSGFTGASKVLFGTTAASFTVNSDTQITAISPAGNGTVYVMAITPGGTSATNNADRFTYVPVPTIASISPTSGPATGGTTVTITGSHLTGASKALFGTVAANFTVNSDTRITAVSPAGSGIVHVTVTTTGGTSATNNADRFTYVPVPVIASVSPTSGPAAGGTVVTIQGSGFTGASKVLFGTVAANFMVNSDTQITAYSPGGSGTVHVTVTTPKGTSVPGNADRFTYLPVPTVASISPMSGPLAGGTTVIITGKGFTEASKVLFGSTASIFTVNSDTQITVVSPAGSGTVHVTVTTPGGTNATGNADQFTYLPVPTVASISLTSGPASGGTFVTITGSGFTQVSQVRFGTVAASNFVVNSDTQITAVSPGGSGTVHVTVTTPGGASATGNADRFTYVPAPTVTKIAPISGPAAGGTTVTITGSGFTGASKVLFGTAVASFTVVSDTQITVTSPAGSGTVHVTVTTPGGTSATSNADLFQYS